MNSIYDAQLGTDLIPLRPTKVHFTGPLCRLTNTTRHTDNPALVTCALCKKLLALEKPTASP